MTEKGPVVFFDAGHTLLYPARGIGEVYAEIARHYGAKPDPDSLEAGFRRAWEKRRTEQGGARPGSKEWWAELVRHAWEDETMHESFPFDDYFEAVFVAFAHPRLWRVYADAWGALGRLQKAGVPMGVLSNWDHRLYAILEGHELNGFFSVLMISEEVGHAKPDVEIFRAAEKAIHREGRYILIGDDPELDGGGAARAGWEFFQIDRPCTDLNAVVDQLLGS